MTEPAIDISNLRFSYTKKAPILNLAELKILRSERTFLYGPSGSGKSTLLGLIAGVLKAEQGTLRVLGSNLTEMSGMKRDSFRSAHIGFIFQMFNLIPYLNVRENILLPCSMSAVRRNRVNGPLEIAARNLASHLGILNLLDRSVLELSVGQQQRVAVARALIGRPELVIADEPTSALDSEQRENFLNLLFKECESSMATLLFVSHDLHLKSMFSKSLSLPELNRVGEA